MKKLKGATKRQKIFAKVVAETGDVRLGMIRAYEPPISMMPSAVEREGNKVVAKPEVRKEILRIWDEAGLTLEVAAAKHKEILESPRTKTAEKLKAIDMVYKGNEIYQDEERSTPNSIIQLFIDQRNERGLPIPIDLEEKD